MKIYPRSVLLAVIAVVSSVAQQTPTVPTNVAIEGPAAIKAGQSGKLTLRLTDAKGKPAVATENVTLRVSAAANTKVDKATVVIPKGQSTADVSISKDTPGLSSIQVQQANAPASTLAGTKQVEFAPSQAYSPVPPLGLWLTVPQNRKLKAGVDAADLIVRYVDANKVSVPISRDTEVSFPGLGDRIRPYPMRIKTGRLFAEAKLTASQPEIISLNPVVSPPTSLSNDATTVEFVSPIVGLRIISDPAYATAVLRPSIKIKVGLFDAQGGWIASNIDRTVLLQLDPPVAGHLGTAEITIPKGQSVQETTFTPQQEGAATIKGITGELPVQSATVEFHYAWVYFLFLAAIGGAVGGIVHNAVTGVRKLKSLVRGAMGGAPVGALVYVVAPLLVTLSLKPTNFQNASKLFEAFVWGFFGGAVGIAVFAKLLAFWQAQAAKTTP